MEASHHQDFVATLDGRRLIQGGVEQQRQDEADDEDQGKDPDAHVGLGFGWGEFGMGRGHDGWNLWKDNGWIPENPSSFGLRGTLKFELPSQAVESSTIRQIDLKAGDSEISAREAKILVGQTFDCLRIVEGWE